MHYDITRRDRQVFVRELLRFGPVLLFIVVAAFNIGFFFSPPLLVLGSGFVAWAVVAAHRRSISRRFYNNKFLLLWNACKDRLERFHSALSEAKKQGVPELQDLPKTVQSVAETLYVALRRADIVLREVMTSEGWLMAVQQNAGPISPDQRAQELYRLADKNIAEYRQHYKIVMSGVERTEAQAAVFTTTLDTLRMRMLGHRLAGRTPELAHTEFLQAMTEARMQLDSIDRALDELELTPFPGTDPDWMESLKSVAEKELDSDSAVGSPGFSAQDEPPPIPPGLRENLGRQASGPSAESGLGAEDPSREGDD
jgi:hypothetical protein